MGKTVLLAFCVAISVFSRQAAAEPFFVYSSDGQYNRAAYVAERYFEDRSSRRVDPKRISEEAVFFCRQGADLIAFGFEVAQALMETCGKSLVVGGITSLELNSLQRRFPEQDISGVVSDREPGFYINAVGLAMPGVKTVGVIYEPEDETWALEVEKEARRVGLEVQLKKTVSSLFIKDFKDLAYSSGAIIVPPRSRYFSKNLLRPLLIISARNRVPIIGGLNEEQVNEGVFLGLVEEDGMMGREVASLYKEKGKKRNEIIRFPYYLLTFNDYIADAMDINLNPSLVSDILYSHEK